MKKKKLKQVPVLKTEQEYADFWNTHDSTEYVDWSKAKSVVFPNVKLSTKSISIRLTAGLLDKIKMIANQKDVPYQSMMKMMLDKAVKEELRT